VKQNDALPARLPLIEYLRGLAATAVAWFHLSNVYPTGWVQTTGSLGWLGVEAFFVISGFVIPHSIARSYSHYSTTHFPRYICRRLIRLEPPYVISMLMALALWHLSMLAPGFQGKPAPLDPWQISAHLFYLIPLTDYTWLQPVYWTLAYEFVFYLTIGLLFPLVGTDKTPAAWYFIAAAVAVAVIFDVLHARTLLFVIGIAVFRAREKIAADSMIELAILLTAGAMIAANEDIRIALVGVLAGGAIWAFPTFAFSGLLHRVLLWLGVCSYSIYLTHVPIGGRVVNFGRRYIEGPASEFLLSIAAFCISLLFAYLFMLVIERPAIALARCTKTTNIERVVV